MINVRTYLVPMSDGRAVRHHFGSPARLPDAGNTPFRARMARLGLVLAFPA